MAECCILINFSSFQDHSYYYKNTDNTKHMLKVHSRAPAPETWGRAKSYVIRGGEKSAGPSPVLSDTPHPSLRACSLFVTRRPLPKPNLYPSPSLQKLPETARAVRCQASRNPCLIILLGKGAGEAKKRHILLFGENASLSASAECETPPWAVGSAEL